MIDFHAHILPGADHGSDGTETSLYQLAQAARAGVTDIVATPHFYPHRHKVDGFLQRREKAWRRLQEAGGDGAIRIYLGAEVLLCAGMEHMDGLEKLCIGGTKVLLVEMPFHGLNDELVETLYNIQQQNGLTVILAHIDRYPEEQVRRAMETGALAQVNAEAACSLRFRFRCLRWADQGMIAALGSDIHMRGKHYEKLGKAYAVLGRYIEGIEEKTQALLWTPQRVSGATKKEI
ncbi:MAG: CpsB/CapC family capsule biosynthesis tyrosine phosphatase [Butyricicoccus sp.]